MSISVLPTMAPLLFMRSLECYVSAVILDVPGSG